MSTKAERKDQQTKNRARLIEQVLHLIKRARYAKSCLGADSNSDEAAGMLHGALILGALTGEEFERLSRVNTEARYYRAIELHHREPPHSREVVKHYIAAQISTPEAA